MSRSAYILSAIAFCSIPVLAAAPLLQDPAAEPPEGMPSHEEMMVQWMTANEPGEHHEHLKMTVGTWDADIQMITVPGAEPQISTGTLINRMILDGRYLASEFTGDFMGMPFTGHGLLAYDNIKQQYVNLWIDSTTTGIMVSHGQCSEDGKVVELAGEMEFPGLPEPAKYRQVMKVLSSNKYTYESFEVYPNGDEHRSMIITYTRQKKNADSREGLSGAGVAPSR